MQAQLSPPASIPVTRFKRIDLIDTEPVQINTGAVPQPFLDPEIMERWAS